MLDSRDTTSATDAVREAAVGEQLAERYRLVERIGEGGMATVYRARDEQLGRDVALKVFRRELASAEDLRRQQAEVRILARLTHPSLVTLYDAVSDGEGRAALVLEYVEGSDVRKRLADDPLPPRAAAAVGRDVARALAHIHGRGIVHRDISPGNILLPDADGHDVHAKLTDLGIARIVDEARVTSTGGVVGTPQYLSPEQAEGREIGPASDVYSLGLVLLECLTGERAFPGTGVESAVARLSHDPAIPQRLGSAWRELLTSMTQRDPERRPSAAHVADVLSEMLESGSADAVEGNGEVATAALPGPTGIGFTKRLPTSRMPIPPHGSTSATTDPLAPAARPAARATTPRQPVRLGRRALGVLAAGAALLVLVLVAMVVWPRGGAGVPAPDVTYPAVPGELGMHLSQLEQDVDPGSGP